jgi:NADP-dependent 3-hydroxy acid dehydrogenase YdfG
MPNAIVTGATSGIGNAIALKLLSLGYTVKGIARSKPSITHTSYCHTQLDLLDTHALEHFCKEQVDVDVLINAAGIGLFKELDYFTTQEITTLLDTNLKAPLLLTNLLTSKLKRNQGTIINISSIEATKHSRLSTIYTATKSALQAFSLTLFEEIRKSGVKVSNINPDITDTAFFDTLSFKPTDDKTTHLIPEQIADAVEYILSDNNRVITDMTIRPQRFALEKVKRK